MKYDAVFFDAGQTLLAPHPSFADVFVGGLAEEGIIAEVGAAAHALEDSLSKTFDELEAKGGPPWSLTKESSMEFWGMIYRRALESLGIPDPTDKLPGIMYERFTRYESYRLFSDAIPTIEAVRAAGITVGLISNFEEWLEGMLIEWEVHHLFDIAAISGKVGVEKPDPAIFRSALERAGVEPQRAVYVGDDPRLDCEAAWAIGMDCILIDRRGRYPAYSGTKITTLDELLPLVLG